MEKTILFSLFFAFNEIVASYDEIKSVFLHPAKQDFVAQAISSTAGGFLPSKTDLTA